MTSSADVACLMLIIGIVVVIACTRNLLVPPPHYSISTDASLFRNLTWAGLLLGTALIFGAVYLAYRVWCTIMQYASSTGG
jgi:hypothetical protein